MALAALVQSGMVKYILSQNCDGLHLRSGISQSNLSEIHGNMYLESCEDEHIHYRCFDVTEKTNIKRHKTGRNCSKCQKPLSDTIVHFGEMNRFNNPYRWESAEINVNDADLIITVGTSLKVLTAYKVLWPKKTKIVVINLQWTPKTKKSVLAINEKSDKVLSALTNKLSIQVPEYKISSDQLLHLATPLGQDDHKPSTPIADFVPVSDSKNLLGKRL